MAKIKIINAEDLNDGDYEHIDARYDQQISKVIPSSRLKNYEVKEWPMLDDGEEHGTNALGYPFDYFRKKRIKTQEDAEKKIALAQEAELKKQQEEERLKAEDAERVTAAELDELRQAAENEGREAGLKLGHDEGYAKGLEEGKTQGYEEGMNKGYEEGLKKGHDEGLNKGFEEGHAMGLSQGEAVVTEQSERFRAMADALFTPLRNIDEEVASEVVRLAAELFRTLARRELKQDPEFLKSSVLNALKHLPAAQNKTQISLNPDDLMVLEAAVGRDYISAQKWELKADEALKSGDILISDGKSEVGSSLEERIDALIEEFLLEASEKKSDLNAEIDEEFCEMPGTKAPSENDHVLKASADNAGDAPVAVQEGS